MAPTKTILSFSGGKDSCLALHALRQDPGVEVVGLLTTIGTPYQRVSHHGVRHTLLIQQANAIGLPLHVIEIEAHQADCAAMDVYESKMERIMAVFHQEGVQAIAFGDLFLEDLRKYREQRNRSAGMQSLFPLWGRDTRPLAERFIDEGFKAVLTCVDTGKLPSAFAGRALDRALINDLPAGVDPCGENGEFHSFVWDGPVFSRAIPWRLGERLSEKNRAFIDLLPASDPDVAPAPAPAVAPAPDLNPNLPPDQLPDPLWERPTRDHRLKVRHAG